MGNTCCNPTCILNAKSIDYKRTTADRTEVPYGYVLVYPGVLTTNENFSSPILSVHTYYLESEKVEFNQLEAQLSNKKKYNAIGPQGALKRERFLTDETVVMIPVEDIIDIYYTTSINKSSEMINTEQDVPIVGSSGCCCCREDPKSLNINAMQDQRYALRSVTIHIQYSKYSNVDTLSNVRILPEVDRATIHKNLFEPNGQLQFHLTHNNIFEPTDFDQKKIQAEDLCRFVMQLKAKNGGRRIEPQIIYNKENEIIHRSRTEEVPISYPNPEELPGTLKNKNVFVFGDILREPAPPILPQLPVRPLSHEPKPNSRKPPVSVTIDSDVL